MKKYLSVFIVGITLFSMFFGGGNLVFPLLMGIHSTSPMISTLGFLLSSVLLPFFGVIIGIYFKGDYERCLSVFGRGLGLLLIFLLLIFWIPLGSGPRCHQLAYGAYCEIGGTWPLWVVSGIYGLIVYVLTVKRNFFMEILGKVVTPLLIFFLFFLIFSLFGQTTDKSLLGEMRWSEFYHAVVSGYNTMDFIASIFFSSAIIALLREKQKDKFQYSFVRNACIIAVSLLTLVYIGMFAIGYINADHLQSVSGARLLASVGHVMFGSQFEVVIFMIITLSVLSTSMALVLVFSDYLEKIIFKGRLPHHLCVLFAVLSCFILSTVGFENLSVFISYAMGVLYPCLLITTAVAFTKGIISQRKEGYVEKLKF